MQGVITPYIMLFVSFHLNSTSTSEELQETFRDFNVKFLLSYLYVTGSRNKKAAFINSAPGGFCHLD